MFTADTTIINLLTPFGLEKEEALIYLTLTEKGVLSALTLSRTVRMGRTRIYRLLELLEAKGLVSHQYGDLGFVYTATEPTKLSQLVTVRENEVNTLKLSLPHVTAELEQKRMAGQPGSKVLYYRGRQGLSQVNWNLVRAKGEFLMMEVDNAEAYLPHDEAEDLRRELLKAKISSRELTNLTSFEPFTEVGELWRPRWIDPAEFTIKADVFIYNDVYALCHFLKDGDIFCVEMYNQELADMQRQLFEYLWTRAKPLKLIGSRGKAALES